MEAMDSPNFTSLYSAGRQQKNGCAETGSLLLSSLLDPSRPPKPHSRDTLGYVSAYPAVNLFPTGSRKRSPPCLTFPIVDLSHPHTHTGGAWCSQVSHLPCTPLTPRGFCYMTSISVLIGSSFSRRHVPTSRVPHSDLARRMFDPDGLYVMAVRGMSNELHALNTAHDARDG